MLYLIPVAWFMMSYPSFVNADWLVPSNLSRWQRILAVAAVGGLAMTAWDVIMDPIMVAGGFWVWGVKGAYFGVPLQNFWGWWLTVFCSYALYLWLFGKSTQPTESGFDRFLRDDAMGGGMRIEDGARLIMKKYYFEELPISYTAVPRSGLDGAGFDTVLMNQLQPSASGHHPMMKLKHTRHSTMSRIWLRARVSNLKLGKSAAIQAEVEY